MNRNNVSYGTCDGTGAAINVCLGYIPDLVIVVNMEDAGSKLPVAFWFKAFAVITAMDEGFKQIGLSDTDFDRTVLTANGISAYDGGDEITYDGATNNRWEDSDGNDVEEVYVDGHYKRDSGSDAAYKCIGDSQVGTSTPRDGQKITTPPGFTIGTDSDLNQNGEQLCWAAFR